MISQMDVSQVLCVGVDIGIGVGVVVGIGVVVGVGVGLICSQ